MSFRTALPKLLFVLLASLLVMALVGCGGTEATTTTAGEATTTTAGSTETTAPGDEFEGLAPITLTYSHFAPASTFPSRQMQHWADEINKRTNGVVTVETFPGGTLLDAAQTWDGVLQGVADIGLGAPSYDPGRFPITSGLSLPVGFPNSTVASLTFWDLLEAGYLDDDYKDFKVITVFTGEPGYLQTKTPVTSQADLRGMKLRAAGTGVPVLAALGASPVGMPMTDVPEAVQTGQIEGTMVSREVLQDFKLAEQLKYVTNYPTVVVSFAAVMRLDKFNALPAPVQRVIEEMGREMAEWTGRYHDEENVGAAMKWAIEEQGLSVVELAEGEKAAWDEALTPLVEEWIQQSTAAGIAAQEFLDKLYELRDKNIAEVGA